LLARETRDTLRTLWASSTCSAIQTGSAVMASGSCGSHCARWPSGQPVLDLIFDVRVKGGDTGDFAVETVDFILDIVELVDDGFVAVGATLGQRAGGVALNTEACHGSNRQHEGDGSNRSQPTLVLIWRVPIDDLIRFQIQRG